MFERFTERARHVVVFAQSEARDLRHDFIGAEHLLLGLLREEEGLAARALGSLGVSAEDVRTRVEELVGRGQHATSGQIPFTPRAKKVLELSLREALRLRHDYIGTEHILLGLVREKDGVAAQILLELDVEFGRVRDEVVEQLTTGPRPVPHLRRRRSGPVAWEHRVDRLASGEELSAERLDAIGEEGWELASVTPSGDDLVLVFKRRRVGAYFPRNSRYRVGLGICPLVVLKSLVVSGFGRCGMLRERAVGESLWEAVLPAELRELPPELGKVDAILDDDRFLAPFRSRLTATIGRPTIPIETYLRLMYLKHRYGLGYETLCREVADSFTWRRFCRIALDGRVPDPSTLMKLTKRLGPELLEELNAELLSLAVERQVLRSRRLRVDTTVVEADIRSPTDSGLCAHAVSRLTGWRSGSRRPVLRRGSAARPPPLGRQAGAAISAARVRGRQA